jgi:hypothetical protein
MSKAVLLTGGITMPKAKLSSEQREAIRAELKERLQRKEPRDEVVKSVGEKFKLTANAVRWYIAGLNGRPKRKRKVSPRRSTKSRRKKGERKAKSTRRGQPALLRIARVLSPKQLKNLSRVQRLLPKHEALQQKGRELEQELAALRRTETRLRRTYRRVTAQARKVGRKLQRLTSR